MSSYQMKLSRKLKTLTSDISFPMRNITTIYPLTESQLRKMTRKPFSQIIKDSNEDFYSEEDFDSNTLIPDEIINEIKDIDKEEKE